MRSDIKVAVKLTSIDDVFEVVLKQQDHGGAWLESIDLCIRLAGVAGKEEPPYFTGKKPVAFVPISRIEWMMSSEKLFGK